MGEAVATRSEIIPSVIVRVLVALLAVGAIVAFAIMFGVGIADVWDAADGVPPTQSDAFLYVATAIAALVGGIVAVGFGVELPDNNANANRLTVSTTGLGTLAIPANAPRAVIGSIYAIVYLILGAAALITWVTQPEETSALVKNLGTTFLGLAVPIVAAFFRD
jgi:hypothetical protein